MTELSTIGREKETPVLDADPPKCLRVTATSQKRHTEIVLKCIHTGRKERTFHNKSPEKAIIATKLISEPAEKPIGGRCARHRRSQGTSHF